MAVWQNLVITGGPGIVVSGVGTIATGGASAAVQVFGGLGGGGVVGIGAGVLYADMVDMEAGDWRVTIGGDANLNFQYDLYNDGWYLEP